MKSFMSLLILGVSLAFGATSLHAEDLNSSSVEQVLNLTQQGNIESQFNLAHKYLTGEGTPQDKQKVLEWISKAAEQGNADAQSFLAMMYYLGDGVSKDRKKAFELFQNLAEQGDPDIQYLLSMMYYRGNTVEQSVKHAFEWCSKAAEGSKPALFHLANMYNLGLGVEQDKKKAFQVATKALEQEKAAPMHNVALVYYFGEGATENVKSAFDWFFSVTKQGYGRAFVVLGTAYLSGKEGVKKDINKAKEYFSRACDLDEMVGCDELKFINR